MKSEFELAFNEVLDERGLPREIILAALETALISAYRKSVSAPGGQEIQVEMDFANGAITILAEKEVSDSIMDDRTEVLLDVAREKYPDAQIGDLVMIESTPENFGRIAAQTAKQAIQQRIRDVERQRQYEYFRKQVGEIVSGVVQARLGGRLTIGLDMKAEAVMERKDLLPTDRFRIHDRIRVYVDKVDNTKDLQIQVSRTHRNFLRRLFEIEIPEIYHGLVIIHSIAREAGKRSKISVSSTQPGTVDAVGACLGQGATRLDAIKREVGNYSRSNARLDKSDNEKGEDIEIILWSPDPATYIKNAIGKAKVLGVYLHPSVTKQNKPTATVVVPVLEQSKAIGKEGQNARLVAMLTGWRIDVLSLYEAAEHSIKTLAEDSNLTALAEQEAETVLKIQELLGQVAEGRVLSADDDSFIFDFVNRVERRGEADRNKETNAQLTEIRESIDPRAFALSIYDIAGIKDHVQNTLTENKIETLGDLLMVIKTDPDSILRLPGISSNVYDSLLTLAQEYSFPEAEAVVEEVEQPVIEEAAVPEAVDEVVQEIPVAEQIEEKDVDTELEEEKSFAELFQMQSATATSNREMPSTEEEEEMKALGPKKQGKKGKKRSGREIEYDPDTDSDVVFYKHRRNEEDGWDQWS